MNLAKLQREFKGEIRLDEPLSRHTTFKIGGKVKIWAGPQDFKSLKLLLKFAADNSIPVLVIGKGSNLLIGEGAIFAIAINLSSENFSQIAINSKGICAGAGVGLNKLIECASKSGLAGLEFLTGIPASVGGAVWMNAASISAGKPCSVADILKEIKVLKANGLIQTISRKDLKFSYKTCGLSQCIILRVSFRLGNSSSQAIKKILKENLQRKRQTQDLIHPSAGCIFKNPCREVAGGLAAGYLIDKAGFKGVKIGDAQVSRQHANFIVNTGKAKAAQVMKLIKLIKVKVRDRFDVDLEPEIKIITNSKKVSTAKRPVFL